MSIRKYSTDNSSDNDDTNGDIALNRAILLSESQSLCMEKSVVTKGKIRSAYGFNTYSVKQTITTSKSSSVKCSLRNHKKTIQSDKESEDQGVTMQNTKTSLPADEKLKVKVTENSTQSCGIISQDQSPNLLPESSKLEVEVSKPRIISNVILSNPIHIVSEKDLDDNLTTHDNIHNETESTKKHINYDKKIDFYLSGTEEKNENKLVSPSTFDASRNAWETMDEFTATNLEKTNIWPALNALDTTFTKSDGNTSKDHAELIENLNKKFNYSPRSFTETLLTIIEESFVESEQASEGLLKFRKKSEEVELLEDICTPNLVASEKSDPLTDTASKYDLHESSSDSTKYISFKKLMSPKVQAKTYRTSVSLDIERETAEVQSSTKINPIKSSAQKKKYRKTPGIIEERGPPKTSPAHRLAIGNSPRWRKNSPKTPKIIIYAATPQSQRKNRRISVQSWDDEEYLTAESDSEESKTNESEEPPTIEIRELATIENEEPVACSSRKLNMSSIAYHHQEWVQAYKKASKYKSVIHRSTAAYHKTEETQIKKLEKMWLRKMHQKRQQCLDLVDQYLEKGEEVDQLIEKQTPSVCNSCKLTAEFLNTLRACSAYLTCGMNLRDACKSTARSRQYVSSLSMNIKKNIEKSPHLSVVHHGRTKSPRRSVSKKNVRVVSPGARYLSPYSKSRLKRQSLKGSNSPGVNSSSLRPVSELRKFFSPEKRAAGSGKSNKNLQDYSPRRNAAFPKRSKSQEKFKHVVSPVAQYIKGNK